MVLKKVLVTGASGMVGRELLQVLRQHDIACIATSRTRPAATGADLCWRPWDLENYKTTAELDDLFPGVDAVIHAGAAVVTAADDPELWLRLLDVNVRATLCLAAWALSKQIPFVFLSSASVYAKPDDGEIMESAPKTSTGIGGFYGLSKSLAEDVLAHLAEKGLNVCILRPSSIYGRGLPAQKMIAGFLSKASADSTIELAAPTDDEVDLLHAADVADAALDALRCEAYGIFNIASGRPSTIAQIAAACIKVAGRGRLEIKAAGATRPPVRRFLLNCDAARKAFNFAPKLSLESGLARMLEDTGTEVSGTH